MTTPPIDRSTCFIDSKIAGIEGVAFRETNDPHHEVETASETVAYAVSRRGRISERVHSRDSADPEPPGRACKVQVAYENKF